LSRINNQYVRFQYSSTYLVEGTVATLRVVRDSFRSDQSLEAFSVDYSTRDAGNSASGSGVFAIAGYEYDYASGAGTLSFNKGELFKEITVTGLPIPGDNDPRESDEFFNIYLSNPVSVSSNVQILGVNPYSVFIVEPS